MKKPNDIFKSDVREILDSSKETTFYKGYFTTIPSENFDKLEKDINNYIKEIINIMAVFMRCIAMVLIVGMILIAIFA